MRGVETDRNSIDPEIRRAGVIIEKSRGGIWVDRKTYSEKQLGSQLGRRLVLGLNEIARRVCRPRVGIHRQEVPALRPPLQHRERDPFSGNATPRPSRGPITCPAKEIPRQGTDG